LLRQFDLTVLKTTELYQNLKIPKGSNALEISNKLFETGLFEFAYPKFIGKYKMLQSTQMIPNDIYFNKQISLHNVGQTFLPDNHSGIVDADIDAPQAWTISTGCNDIIVAVIDDGVVSNHPDLPNDRQIRLNGSNFADGDPDNPSPTGNSNHGTACAGIIAASMNNSIGIAGISPNCKIMPIRIFNSNGTDPDEDSVAEAIKFAVDNGANILSNSWGAPTDNQNYQPKVVAAIQYAIDNGCTVVFAAGNSADWQYNLNGPVYFPANVAINGVITVGASDRNDHQSNYSPYAFAIDLVAPSSRSISGTYMSGELDEMWSIDISGTSGWNPIPSTFEHPPTTGESIPNNDQAYTARFGGTSYSCAVVAGVAALMLSVDLDLNSLDVLNKLTSTADKVGGYNYVNGRCNEMGYGRINAYQALLLVTGGPITGNNLVCRSTNRTFTYTNPPSGKTIYWTKSNNLEYVSGQNTNFYTVRASSTSISGEGWVRASLSDCHDVGLIYPVWVGGPAVTISGATSGSVGNSYTYYEDPAVYSNPTSFIWTLSPPVDGNTIYGYDYWANAVFYGDGGYYQIGCTPTNICGTGSMATTYIDIYDPDFYIISPNPASDIVTISVKKSSINSTDDSYMLQVIDMYGSLFYTSTKSGDRFTFPVNNLKNGTYIVQITNDKKTSNLILVVKH